MNQASEGDEDIIIHLRNIDPECGIGDDSRSDSDIDDSPLCFNVSGFLRRHDCDDVSRNFVAKVDEFTQLLDAKVHIDISDPKYSHIYQGINIIVERVVEGLTKLDPYFDSVELRLTGSSLAGVKVGLPHERDYILKLPKDKLLKSGDSFDTDTLFPLVQQIVDDQTVALTEGLAHWMIHGVGKHSRIGGVCLVMQCCAIANEPTSEEVGVTVDLVPVYVIENTDKTLNDKAKAYLPHSLEEYAEKGDIFRLLDEDRCDMGLIENAILKQSENDIKRAFRVAKFLISNSVTAYIPYASIETLDEETLVRQYGRSSYISSYALRVLFLHLLLNVHGTEAEQKFKGGLLVLCLLDMLELCSGEDDIFDYNWNHPLIKDEPFSCYYIAITEPIEDLLCRLKTEKPADLVEEFSLLNNKTKLA